MNPGQTIELRTRTAAALEVAALIALVLTYIWVWQGSFPGNAQLIVALYFGIGIASHLRRGESARQIGVRLDNWRPALRNAALVVGIALLVPLRWARYSARGTSPR